MNRSAPIIAGTLAALLLLFGAYMGAYYAMLSPMQITFGNPSPVYRNNSDLVRMSLQPAHQLDRLIRPGCWVTITGTKGTISAGTLTKKSDNQIYESAGVDVE